MGARQWPVFIVLLLLRLPVHADALDLRPVNTILRSDPDVSGLAVMDEQTVYFYWNDRMVTAPAITAVELASGRHLWSISANLHQESAISFPGTFQARDGWLMFETVEDSIDDPRTVGPSKRTLHVVNGQTGEEHILPRSDPNRLSYVWSPFVQRGHCVTYDGTVIRCSDGHIVGELGPGDHYSFIVDGGHLFVMTTTEDRANAAGAKRFVRKFDITTMQLMSEMEFPLQNLSPLVAAKGNIALFSGKSDDQRQLFCVDLSDGTEKWRIAFPDEVSPLDGRWEGKEELVFHQGTYAIIRPVRLNIANGQFAPDACWIDPRSILGWYQSRSANPDFVAATPKFVIGRWQQQQVICVDPSSGQLLWKHFDSDDCVGRLFTDRRRLGDYFVAGSYDRFNIVSVSTGETRSILPSGVGLTAAAPRRPSADVETSKEPSFLDSAKFDRLKDSLLLATPLLPLIIWLMWRFLRRRAAIGKGNKPNDR